MTIPAGTGPRVTPLSVRDLGPQFVDNPHRMVGQDGAYSFPVSDGAFWFFGDTLIGQRVPGQSLWMVDNQIAGPDDLSGRGTIEAMPTNTALILRTPDASQGLTDYEYLLDARGKIRQIIDRLPGEDRDTYRIWCLHGCLLGGKVFLFYQKIHMLKEGPMPVNFELVGVGLSVGREGDWTFERLAHKGETVWWGSEVPQFGAAVLFPPNLPHIYLFGVKKQPDGQQLASVARVLPARIADPTAYEYFGGDQTGWGRDPARSAPLFEGPPNELSVSYNRHLGEYLAVHSMNLSGDIVARTAPNPWGPWTDPVTLWKVTPSRQPVPGYPNMIYAAKEHPELSREKERVIYVTYIEFEEYYPHLLEVTLR